MTDAEKIKKAQQAISHVLNRIRDSQTAAEVFGFGTQSFALLTDAAAALYDKPVEPLRDYFSGASDVQP